MEKMFKFLFFSLMIFSLHAEVTVGAEILFTEPFIQKLSGKKIGLITNQTAVDKEMKTTLEKFLKKSKLTALFAPEHGLDGSLYAGENVNESRHPSGVPIYSLHGKTRRPTPEMLKGIDLLVYDIQDVGSRTYTYTTTLFYAMEEAAKLGIEVMVLDRPNPINGTTIDGPMLEESCRSFIGYVNVPYCHGMTIGELARFFNEEYKIGCKLTVIPMRGWKREMNFTETGLPWVPTSPNIPEPTSPLYYPTTGILGELSVVSCGIGYTLPFKVIGAPWIKADEFAAKLNQQNYPGVVFYPFHFRPFMGSYAKKDCHGVLVHVTNPSVYLPVSTQYLLIGILKILYPKEFKKAFDSSLNQKRMFTNANGTEKVWEILNNQELVAWKLRAIHANERKEFAKKRLAYLLY